MAKKTQKKNGLNMRTVVFLVILIYMIIHVVTFLFKSSIDVYEVKAGKVVDFLAVHGIVVREEEIVKSNGDGYISFFTPDQSKVYNGEIVYTVDEDGKIKEYISEQISAKKKSKKKNMKSIQGIVEDFGQQYDRINFDSVYSTKQKIDNAVLNTNEEYIQKALEKYQEDFEGTEHPYQVGRNKRSGVLSFAMDDFTKQKMSKVDASDFKKDSFHQTRLGQNAKVKKGDSIYRLVTSENWGMVVELKKDEYEELQTRESAKVTFAQNNIQCNAGIKCRKEGKHYFAELSFNKYMIRFINDRFLDVELSLDSNSGYKIPKTSVKKEEFYRIPTSYLTKGGNSNTPTLLAKGPKDDKKHTLTGLTYYIYAKKKAEDKDVVYVRKHDIEKNSIIFEADGSKQMTLDQTVKKDIVYCVNAGYAQMRIVDIIDEEDDYYLIKSGTDNGVRLADHIAENYKDVNENRIVY